MRHLINKLTGGDMWVADSREKEYLEAGHKPVSITAKPTAPCATLHKTGEEIQTAMQIKPEEEKPGKTEKPKQAVKPKRRK